MQVFNTIASWLHYRNTLKGSIGFVATMGNLHTGHASLIQKSLAENDFTIVSIFINPMQFNNPEDFRNYPQTLEADLNLLATLGIDGCFVPNADELYPDDYLYQIHETKISLIMEGQHRPNHFNGMLTVVAKLLNLIQPNRTYFGEKDYQQYLLVQGMSKALFMPIVVTCCATVRHSSGLAYSSRNHRLNATELSLAHQFARIFQQQTCSAAIMSQLQKLNIKIEYLEEHWQRRFIAVYIGEIRLIDNYELANASN